MLVFAVGSQTTLPDIGGRTPLFLVLSGLSTGGSWLCYFKALQDGPVRAVVPIDKLSILMTVLFARFAFHERLTRTAAFGLALFVAGTILML